MIAKRLTGVVKISYVNFSKIEWNNSLITVNKSQVQNPASNTFQYSLDFTQFDEEKDISFMVSCLIAYNCLCCANNMQQLTVGVKKVNYSLTTC